MFALSPAHNIQVWFKYYSFLIGLAASCLHDSIGIEVIYMNLIFSTDLMCLLQRRTAIASMSPVKHRRLHIESELRNRFFCYIPHPRVWAVNGSEPEIGSCKRMEFSRAHQERQQKRDRLMMLSSPALVALLKASFAQSDMSEYITGFMTLSDATTGKDTGLQAHWSLLEFDDSIGFTLHRSGQKIAWISL